MGRRKRKEVQLPTMEQVVAERERLYMGNRFKSILNSTIAVLVVVAAIAVLVSTLWLPVLQIYGSSMHPTLSEGEIVVLTKTTRLETGDIVAFYYNNKILVKRVIGSSGDWINITEDGTVYVNNVSIEEPYLEQRSFGECDIELPYQVPEGAYFVMGDQRDTSIDSRSTTVGCIREEQLVGCLFLRIWPLEQITLIP